MSWWTHNWPAVEDETVSATNGSLNKKTHLKLWGKKNNFLFFEHPLDSTTRTVFYSESFILFQWSLDNETNQTTNLLHRDCEDQVYSDLIDRNLAFSNKTVSQCHQAAVELLAKIWQVHNENQHWVREHFYASLWNQGSSTLLFLFLRLNTVKIILYCCKWLVYKCN